MPTYEPSTQPTSVTPSGVTVEISVPPGFRRFRLGRIRVIQIAGSASQFTAILGTDASFSDESQTIAKWTDVEVVDDPNDGIGFDWDWELGSLHMNIVPDIGTDNDYEVYILVPRRT